MDGQQLIEAWQATINGPEKSWVLFENCTCVILERTSGRCYTLVKSGLMKPELDRAAQATALLKEWGPVYPGTSHGDFGTITLENGRGWVVYCHHDDILTFVGPDEVEPDAEDVVIGFLGRTKRGQDAEELRVLHIEDKRARNM